MAVSGVGSRGGGPQKTNLSKPGGTLVQKEGRDSFLETVSGHEVPFDSVDNRNAAGVVVVDGCTNAVNGSWGTIRHGEGGGSTGWRCIH